MSEIWNTLDRNTQNYIATEQAGATQFQNFAALMLNFSTAVEGAEVAMNSAGSAARENEAYMEGLSAKTETVAASFEQLSNAVIPTGLVKAVLDLANGFLKLGQTPIGTFVTQLSLLTGVMWGGTGLIRAMKVVPAFLSDTAAVLSLTAPQLTLVAAGISAVILLAPKLIDLIKRWTDETYDAEKNIESYNDELDTNKKRLEELNKIPPKNRSSDINEEIESLKKQNEELERNIKLEQQRINIDKFNKLIADKPVAGTGSISSEGVDLSGGAPLKFELPEIETGEQRYQAIFDNLKAKVQEFQQGAELTPEFINSYEEYKGQLKELLTVASDVEETQLPQWVRELREEFKEVPDITKDATDQLYSVEESLELLNDGFAINKLQLNQLEEAFPGLSAALEETNQGWISNTDSMGAMLEKMGQCNDSAKALSEAYKALTTHGGATKQQVDLLTSVFPELSGVMRQNESDSYGVAGAYYYDAKALVELAKTGNSWAIAMIEDQNGVTKGTIKAIQSRMAALQKEMDALASVYSSYSDDGLGVLDYDQMVTAKNAADRMDALKRELQYKLDSIYGSYTDAYANTGGLIVMPDIPAPPSIGGGGGGSSSGGSSSGGGSRPSKPTEDPAVTAAKEQLELYKKLFAFISQKAQGEIDILNKQKEEIQKQNEALEEQIRLQEALDNLAKARQQKHLVFKDGSLQLVSDVDAIAEAQKQVDEIKRQQSQQEKLDEIDDQIQYWQDLKDTWGSAVTDYTDIQDALLIQQKLGIDLEGDLWKERLDNLEDYITEYNRLIGQAGGYALPNSALSGISTASTMSATTYSGDMARTGELNPSSIMQTPVTYSGSMGQTIGITIQNFNPSLPNVTDGEGFANYLKNSFYRQVIQTI